MDSLVFDTSKNNPYKYISRVSYRSKTHVTAAPDLGSLSWLQRDNILKIRPIDGDDLKAINDNNLNKISCPPQRTMLPPPSWKDTQSNQTLSTEVAIPSTPIKKQQSQNSQSSSIICMKQPNENLFLSNSLLSVNPSENLSKPSYSYTHLIFMAIESSPTKCMTVNQIYNWCETNFPFYKQAGAGWKNSLRHNLSINKSFKRLPRDGRNLAISDLDDRIINTAAIGKRNTSFVQPISFALTDSEEEYSSLEDDVEGPGRGAFWTVEPRERQNLLDALRRNPINLNTLSALAANANSRCSAASTLSMINSLGQSTSDFALLTAAACLKPSEIFSSVLEQSLDNEAGQLSPLFNSDSASSGKLKSQNPDYLSAATKLLFSGLDLSPRKPPLLQTLQPVTDDTSTPTVLSVAANAAKIICRAASPPPELPSSVVGAGRAKSSNWSTMEDALEEEYYEDALRMLHYSSDLYQSHLLNCSFNTSNTIAMSGSSNDLFPLSNRQLKSEEVTNADVSNNFAQSIDSISINNPESGVSKRAAVKQRRKSRLIAPNPQVNISNRVASSRPFRLGYKIVTDRCVECKENEGHRGCELFCKQRQQIHYYTEPSGVSDTYQRELQQRSPQSILDQLDDDQEIGPAGFPAFALRSLKMVDIVYPSNIKLESQDSSELNEEDTKHLNQPEMSTTALLSEGKLENESTDKLAGAEDEEEEAVFVTPAPYLDHEYSHCQAGLRKMHENQMVSRYNSRLRWFLENRGLSDFNSSCLSRSFGLSNESQSSILSNSLNSGANSLTSQVSLVAAAACAALALHAKSNHPDQTTSLLTSKTSALAAAALSVLHNTPGRSGSLAVTASTNQKYDDNLEASNNNSGLFSLMPTSRSRRVLSRISRRRRNLESKRMNYTLGRRRSGRTVKAPRRLCDEEFDASTTEFSDEFDKNDVDLFDETMNSEEELLEHLYNRMGHREIKILLNKMNRSSKKSHSNVNEEFSSDDEEEEFFSKDEDAESCSSELPGNASPDVLEREYLRYAASRQKHGHHRNNILEGPVSKRPKNDRFRMPNWMDEKLNVVKPSHDAKIEETTYDQLNSSAETIHMTENLSSLSSR